MKGRSGRPTATARALAILPRPPRKAESAEQMDAEAAELLARGDPSFAILALTSGREIGPALRRELVRDLRREIKRPRGRQPSELERREAVAYTEDMRRVVQWMEVRYKLTREQAIEQLIGSSDGNLTERKLKRILDGKPRAR